MKKIFLILIVFCLFSCVIACSGNKNVVNKTNLDVPEWINEKKALSAVGIAAPSKGGLQLQIAKADLDAKGNLAAKIGSDISRITKNALRSANVNEQDDVEGFFAQATKEVVTNFPLSGVSRDKMYIAKDGTLFVLVSMDVEVYQDFLSKSQKSLINKLHQSKLSRENIKASEEASKEIFSELEKERK
jgi:hypothetical protein